MIRPGRPTVFACWWTGFGRAGSPKRKRRWTFGPRTSRPSTGLREEFNHRPEKFAEFKKHYRLELSKNPALAAFCKELKRPKVTLLFGARDAKINHAAVLAEYLRGAKKKPAAKKKPQAAARRRSR